MRNPTPGGARPFLPHVRALLFSALAAGLILIAPGFPHGNRIVPLTATGKTGIPQRMVLAIQPPTAVAAELNIPEASPPQTSPVNYAPVATPVAERQKPLLPEGFAAVWQTVTLDGQPVEVLQKPFTLRETWHQSGSEYFTYAAWLFDEAAKGFEKQTLASGVPGETPATLAEPGGNAETLAGRLRLLSVLAETMGASVRQASALRYDGAPSTDMSHLRVRSEILFLLEGLQRGTLRVVDVDQSGKAVKVAGKPSPETRQDGDTLRAFVKARNDILNDPLIKSYPQTLELVTRQGELIEQLARHLETRWESRFFCNNPGRAHCTGTATYMRVYARQTLPESEIRDGGFLSGLKTAAQAR